MSNRIIYPLLALAIVFFWWGVLNLAFQLVGSLTNPRVYDCSMAEFHPDFTPEVRKACREQRSRKL